MFRTWIRETIHRRKIGKMRLTAVIYNTALHVQAQIHNKSFLARIHTGRQPRNLAMSCPCMFFSKKNRNVPNCKSEEISSDFQFFRLPCLSPIWKLTSQIWNRTQAAHIWKSEECATQTCFPELLKTRPFFELQIFRSEESEALKQGLKVHSHLHCQNPANYCKVLLNLVLQ